MSIISSVIKVVGSSLQRIHKRQARYWVKVGIVESVSGVVKCTTGANVKPALDKFAGIKRSFGMPVNFLTDKNDSKLDFCLDLVSIWLKPAIKRAVRPMVARFVTPLVGKFYRHILGNKVSDNTINMAAKLTSYTAFELI